MINQPQAVFSYTIPYYTTKVGDTDELFISEQTYESYLTLSVKKLFIIHGSLHPVSPEYGEFTQTLFDREKAILVIGTKDLQEYTYELLDLAIASELERISKFQKETFTRYLYDMETPEHVQIFIGDLQATFENIAISKRLIKKGYRVIERETELAKEFAKNAATFQRFKPIPTFHSQQTLFLVSKLIYVYFIDSELYSSYKKQLQKYLPTLLIDVEKLLKKLKKTNFTSTKGREKAFIAILKDLKYSHFVKKIGLGNIEPFTIFDNYPLG